MKQQLAFVRGALAKKDLVPVLNHFHIYNGRIQGGNGRLSIDTPCEELAGLNVTVPGERFLRAIDACDGEPTFKVTEANSLMVKRGRLNIRLPLLPQDSYPRAQLSDAGERIQTTGSLLGVLRALEPFIGDDASRPWSCGVLLKGGYAYATNNISLVRIECPYTNPDQEIVLPSYTIDELLRISQEPTWISIPTNQHSIVFGYSSGAWLQSLLIDLRWPDVDKRLTTQSTEQAVTGVDLKTLTAAIQKISPFCSDKHNPVVLLSEQGVSTVEAATWAEVGGLALPQAKFRADTLLPVLAVSHTVDFSFWPRPCPFASSDLIGIIVGVRDNVAG